MLWDKSDSPMNCIVWMKVTGKNPVSLLLPWITE